MCVRITLLSFVTFILYNLSSPLQLAERTRAGKDEIATAVTLITKLLSEYPIGVIVLHSLVGNFLYRQPLIHTNMLRFILLWHTHRGSVISYNRNQRGGEQTPQLHLKSRLVFWKEGREEEGEDDYHSENN